MRLSATGLLYMDVRQLMHEQDYDSSTTTAAPVTDAFTIKTAMIIMASMKQWHASLPDMKGAFLNGIFVQRGQL